MSQTKKFFLLFVSLSLLFASSYAEEEPTLIEIFTTDAEGPFPIYSNGIVYPEWNTMLLPRHTCSSPATVIEYSAISSRSFDIVNKEDFAVTVDEIDIRAQNNMIMKPIININTSIIIAPGETWSWEIEYNCHNSVILSKDFNGWTYIGITVKIDTEIITFDYIKVCTLENRQAADLSIWIVQGIAILVIAFSTRQTRSLITDQSQQMDEIRPIHTIYFIIFASISLLSLYFFSEYIKDFVTLIFIFYALTGCSVIFAVWTERYVMNIPFLYHNHNFKILGPINVHAVLSFLVAAAVVGIWFFTRNWFLNNVIGISIVCLIFKVVRLSSLKVGALLLGLAFLYDIFWVFISKPIFGKSVMVVAATALDLPIKIEWPYLMDTPLPKCSLLGLGDMVLPGFFVAFAYRFSLYKKSNVYFLTSVLAYAVGLLLCAGVLAYTHVGQPALLYIVPCLLGTALFVSDRKGDLKDMWEGVPENYQYLDISIDTIPSRIQLSDTSLAV
jgi:signal peptide peptidase-like protein 2B